MNERKNHELMNGKRSSEGFDEENVKRISQDLNKKLGPEFISYRSGFNGMNNVAYIQGWTVIRLANRIFGFNGWSSEIRSMSVDCEEGQGQQFRLGISCTVRVTLKDGTYREDVGFGSAENARTRMTAYEKAKKEAATDALKRALRQFGDSLGNCCYDKKYLLEIQRIHKINEKALESDDLFRNDVLLCPDEEDGQGNISLDIDYCDLSDSLD